MDFIYRNFSSEGLIWSEIKQLWDTGAKEYVSDMWNVADFVTNALYLATIALRLRAYYDVSQTLVLLEINFPDKCVFLLILMSQSDRSRKCQKDINYHIEDKLLSGGDSIVLLEIIIRQHLSSMFH